MRGWTVSRNPHSLGSTTSGSGLRDSRGVVQQREQHTPTTALSSLSACSSSISPLCLPVTKDVGRHIRAARHLQIRIFHQQGG